jgi:hypothetical protein
LYSVKGRLSGAETFNLLTQECFMKLVTVEVRYEGGTVITDRVVLNSESAKITLPLRLSSLLDILDEYDRRESFIARCAGVDFVVEGDREQGYSINFNVRTRPKRFPGLRTVLCPTASQRKANGSFAHMLSTWALIGACFEVATATSRETSLLEPIVLFGLAVALFVIGNRCFSPKDISEQ